ncbi:rhomboid family intramembrane serine protease [Neptunicella sp. SCSIO 80796]|uniref:rhomboid family intramembrane serine protease n=1 Tax=Neptunicella plasticusilytica TaxID=3117012 RepID=UPI003A4E05B1
MGTDDRFKNSFILSLLFVCLLWWVKLGELFLDWDLSVFGVLPMHSQGLIGIFAAPLIHGSLNHIFSNTLPTLILGTLLLYGYPKSRWWVLLIVWLGSGLGVWLFAREATHIGASGLSHGMFFFLLVASILRRDKRSVAIMMIVFLLYGSMTMTIFPREPNISFEYHFFGAIAGSLCAFIFWRRDPKPVEKKYQWEGTEDDDPLIGDEWQDKSD